ncbi:MAG: hypothetical protein EOO52_18500 [Gammaproteobacteria bacterium]|nr:MAG: hypothetical protein EOO52_18500 [Gammaproteobacteria bacterium]
MKFRFLLSFIVPLFLLLTACATRPPLEANWPTDIPPREFFIAHYESDLENKTSQDVDEYLLWVIRFYNGWELYRNGWTKVTEDSLHGVNDPSLRQEIRTKMGLIGEGIACEWAKGKKDRRILTRHVVVWGNALIESIKRDQELALINRVLADVNGLLLNQVALDEVKAERYFPRDDDVFM